MLENFSEKLLMLLHPVLMSKECVLSLSSHFQLKLVTGCCPSKVVNLLKWKNYLPLNKYVSKKDRRLTIICVKCIDKNIQKIILGQCRSLDHQGYNLQIFHRRTFLYVLHHSTGVCLVDLP